MTTQPHGVVPQWTRGDRLRKARQRTGMNTRDFAKHIGVSQKTVTDAEGDKRATVRRPVMVSYAMASGIPLEWLETGTDPFRGDGGQPGARVNSGCSARTLPDAA